VGLVEICPVSTLRTLAEEIFKHCLGFSFAECCCVLVNQIETQKSSPLPHGTAFRAPQRITLSVFRIAEKIVVVTIVTGLFVAMPSIYCA
jgi:hypothetical protein